MPAPLLATKLFIPPAGKNLVVRPRLLERLDAGLEAGCRLTLVCAPAGFGKTTLVSTWTTRLKTGEHRLSPSVAWVSLDFGDDDPVRFWSYLIAALQTQQEGIGKQALALLQAPQTPNLESVLPLLVNDLVQVSHDIILILDDFHLVRTPVIHQSLSFLLDHLPPQVHIMILSRTEPSLPLALLRGRGQLLEVRLADLRFSREEAANYLNSEMKLALSPTAIETLTRKTEGWATGLQMAAVSLRNKENTEEFITSFSGSNRFILDYLIEEVLINQPPEIQEFLLQTSILESFCGPLCDALLRRKLWGAFRDSAAIVEYLENYNLFIVSLDDERSWYRYHQLFADLLRAKLAQKGLELVTELQKRAAEWFEKNGMVEEAVYYTHAAKDYANLVRLIEQNCPPMIQKGLVSSLIRWVRLVPADLVLSRSWLCILSAWWYIEKAEMEEAAPLLDRAESLVRWEEPDKNTNETLGIIYSLRTQVLETRGDIPGTITTAHQALDLLDPANIAPRASVDYSLGRAYYDSGDLVQAGQIWSEFIRIALKAEIFSIYAVVIGVCSNILGIQGKLNEAMRMSQEAIDFINAKGADRFFLSGNPYLSLGIMYYQKNELVAAERFIEEGVKQNQPWGNLNVISTGYTFRARVQIARGNLEVARAYLQEEERINQGYTPYFDISSDYRACRVRFCLEKGDIAGAARLVEENDLHSDDALCFRLEQDHISLARVLIARGNLAEADSLLVRLAEAARSGCRFGRLINILNLRAVILHAMGNVTEALRMLEASLALAEPEGYLRIFVDEGKPMAELLGLAYQKGMHAEYAQRLLAGFPDISLSLPAAEEVHKKNLISTEGLSAREMEVLQLIAGGLANKEIAQKLCISLRTVKFHTTGIYTKLGVDGRLQASVRARELGLLK
jgi:LuxR family transcriptional regulator, maltose regulon positive regulatory protein